MTPSKEVDQYIAALPDDRRDPMSQLRAAVNAAAPDATEGLAYKMPALRLNGRFLVSYDAYKAHYSLFPASDPIIAELGDEVAPYVRGKGTFQFKASEPLPLDLIRRIVELRVREVATEG